ncbi:MAG: hypothetical protein DRI90_13255 [Deltaproteobacteria bacterium]|nr:MAG: hypothetical protein DRI90_13255 [Deltaproteobacteria bacterium]
MQASHFVSAVGHHFGVPLGVGDQRAVLAEKVGARQVYREVVVLAGCLGHAVQALEPLLSDWARRTSQGDG